MSGLRGRPQAPSRCGGTFSRVRVQRFCGDACAAAWAKATFTKPGDRRAIRRAKARAQNRRRKAMGWRRKDGRWREVCEAAGWACSICRGPIDPALRFPDRMAGSVDHIVPLSKGGTDERSNLAAAHYSCNSRRGDGASRAERSFRAKLGRLNRKLDTAAAARDARWREMTI